ncbi:MAG: hypothetical protein ACKPKO_07510, partial [Candidatus Fonsibacter sp.]
RALEASGRALRRRNPLQVEALNHPLGSSGSGDGCGRWKQRPQACGGGACWWCGCAAVWCWLRRAAAAPAVVAGAGMAWRWQQ